jgi:hypothetical protein
LVVEHGVEIETPDEQNDPAGQILAESMEEIDPPGQNLPAEHATHVPLMAKKPGAHEQAALLVDAADDTAPEGHENNAPPVQ